MQIPKTILNKVVTPISKKTGVSPQIVSAVLTIGIPLVWGYLTKKKVTKK